jgi:uncharacterized protein (TIGR03435 family)
VLRFRQSHTKRALLLREALVVQRFQVVGAPAWIDSERFMIEAKPPASSKLSSFTPSNREAPLVEEQRQMRARLADALNRIGKYSQLCDQVMPVGLGHLSL